MNPSDVCSYYKSEQVATDGNTTVSFPTLTLDREGTFYYTIREIVPGAGAGDETFVKDGITYDVSKHQVAVTVRTINGKKLATVKYDGKNDLTISNTVEKKTGNLELTKTIKGDITEEEAEGALRFEVKSEDGKWLDKDGNLSEEKVELTLADFQHEEGTKEYTLKIEGVDLGNYSITETTKDVSGKDVTVKYSVNGGEATEGTAAAAEVKDGETATVAFEDDYKNQTGNLELTKTIKGDITEEEAAGALTFQIKTKDG
jgi:pilin isopeptide linkage protein